MTSTFKLTAKMTAGAAAIALAAAAPLSVAAQSADMDSPSTAITGGSVSGDTGSDMNLSAQAGAGADSTEAPAGPTIAEQGGNTVLASDLMGAPVQNADGDSVGDIDNLLITADGKVQGVVIGVGGFLGIGEKDVAVSLASLQVMPGEDGTPVLTTSLGRDDLKDAPAFMTLAQQKKQAGDAAVQGSATGTGDLSN